jgi:hypothetical protein
MSLTPEEFEKSKQAFESLKTSMKDGYRIQSEMNKGLGEYAKVLKEIGEQQKNINYIEGKLAESIAKRKDIAEKLNAEEERIRHEVTRLNALIASGNKDDKKRAKEKLVILRKQTIELKEQLAAQDGIISKGNEYLKIQKENLEIAKKAAKEASFTLASMKSLSKLPGFAKKWGFDKLKGWGLFEMDKEIRNAARSMNVGKKDFEGFSRNIGKAAQSTVVWGVNAKELAVMQRGYSEAIGRSVELTEDGHKAMALMAEGTGLGTEFAIQMASEMDKFGASVKTSKDLIAGTIKQAGKVGVNGAAASKKLVSLLKLSQTYVFKGGQEGLKKMASDAERLKLDIEGAASFADKVMRPEGAVETAALLTTMGGEFAKLGDPFQLMFKARNDFAGFTKDLGKASSEFVEFNAQTGSFDIKGGLARDRMMEISKITGVQMDKLQEMASAEKKLQMIQGKAPVGISNQEDLDLISSLAEVGKGGEIMIKMHGKDPFKIEELNAGMLKEYKQKQQDLEAAAEQSRTFDEVISDLIDSFKQTLLPFIDGLKVGLGEPIQALIKEWRQNGFYTKLEGWGKSVGELLVWGGKFIKVVGGWIGEWPKLSAALVLLFGPAKWFANGLALRAGFNSLGGFGGGAGRGAGGPNMFGQSAMMGNAGFGSKFAAAGASGVAIGGGALAGLGSGISEYSEQKSMGKSTGEASTKAITKGLATGIGTWGGMALGAALAPATGGLSLLLPLLLGGAGSMVGGMAGDALIADDALIANDGKNNGGPGSRIQFNPHDKFMSFDDVMIAGTNAGANGKLADEIKGKGKDSNKSSTINGKINHIVDVMMSIPNATEFTRLITQQIISDPETLRLLNVGINTSNNAHRNYGKFAGKPKKPLN